MFDRGASSVLNQLACTLQLKAGKNIVSVRVGDRLDIMHGDMPSGSNPRDADVGDRRALYASREVRIPLVRYGKRNAALRRHLLPLGERFAGTTIRIQVVRRSHSSIFPRQAAGPHESSRQIWFRKIPASIGDCLHPVFFSMRPVRVERVIAADATIAGISYAYRRLDRADAGIC